MARSRTNVVVDCAARPAGEAATGAKPKLVPLLRSFASWHLVTWFVVPAGLTSRLPDLEGRLAGHEGAAHGSLPR